MFFIFTPNLGKKKPFWLILTHIFQYFSDGLVQPQGLYFSSNNSLIFRFKKHLLFFQGLPSVWKEQARRYDAERKALMDHSGTSFERSYEALAVLPWVLPWEPAAV